MEVETNAAIGTIEQLNTPPMIGANWCGQGGIYIGLAAADGGLPQGHLILCDIPSPKDMKWAAAVKWAKAQTADGHTDFRLPTRFEAALIYANGRTHVDQNRWHWTGTEPGASCAWGCTFTGGSQYYSSVSSAGAARAVRRFVL